MNGRINGQYRVNVSYMNLGDRSAGLQGTNRGMNGNNLPKCHRCGKEGHRISECSGLAEPVSDVGSKDIWLGTVLLVEMNSIDANRGVTGLGNVLKQLAVVYLWIEWSFCTDVSERKEYLWKM